MICVVVQQVAQEDVGVEEASLHRSGEMFGALIAIFCSFHKVLPEVLSFCWLRPRPERAERHVGDLQNGTHIRTQGAILVERQGSIVSNMKNERLANLGRHCNFPLSRHGRQVSLLAASYLVGTVVPKYYLIRFRQLSALRELWRDSCTPRSTRSHSVGE